MVLLFSLVFIGQLIIFRKLFRVKNLVSPIYITIFFYLTTAVLGYTIYSLYPDFASFGYTSIKIELKPEEYNLTLQYFLASTNIILLGAMIFLTIVNARKSINKNRMCLTDVQTHFSKKSGIISRENEKFLNSLSANLKPSFLTFLCAIPTFMLIVGMSPELILYREEYLESSNRFLVSIGSVLVTPTYLALGYNLANKKISLLNRSLCLLLVLINFIIFFSAATRSLSLIPILITVGYWFNNKRNKLFATLLTALSIILFSPLFYLAIFLRGQSHHGFIPYISYVSELNPSIFFTSPLGFISNLLFAFPLTGQVIKQKLLQDYPISYLLTSLNPIPGDFAGWYSINQKLRLNEYTPFNTIGEMYLYGDMVSFWLFLSLGFILMFMTLVFQRNLELGRITCVFLIFMLTILFCFISLQYNLRSSTRILYLAFILACFFYKIKIG